MAVQGEVGKLLREADLPDQHPIDGLLEVVRHSGAMMRFLGNMTGQLGTDPGQTWTTVQTGEHARRRVRWARNMAVVGFDHEGDQAADVLIALYEKWCRLYLQACKTAIDADLDERMVRNATATSNAFLEALTRSMHDANLTGEQRLRFTETMGRELRSLPSNYASL